MRTLLTVLLVGVLLTVGHAAPAAKERDPSTLPALLQAHRWQQYNAASMLSFEKQRAYPDVPEWEFYKPTAKDDPTNRSRIYLTSGLDKKRYPNVGTIHVNTKATPIWMDFIYDDNDGKTQVYLGIVRFDGDYLHWLCYTNLVDSKAYADARGDVPQRPKSFTDKDGKPKGYRLERMPKE